LRAEVSITVAAELGLVEAHDIAHTAEHELLHAVPKLDDATVHVSPGDDAGSDFHARVAHHR
jgi:divalent metal cation (Fe/Co/Zn/Cd) transporter